MSAKQSNAGAPHRTLVESRDLGVRKIVVALTVIIGMLVTVLALCLLIQWWLSHTTDRGQSGNVWSPARVLPPQPRLLVHPPEEMNRLHTDEEKRMNTFGRNSDGTYHMPVSNAMDEIVPRLPVREGAPVGLTTPEGAGRQFAESRGKADQAIASQEGGK